MTYAQHKAAGEQMDPPAVDDLLKVLGRDERFKAMAALLERHRETYILSGCRQEFASDHGRLAHCQGSIHALNMLCATLAQLFAPEKVQGGIPRPEGL